MALLFLLRHAKAQLALPGVRDFDRPLSGLGAAQAEETGRMMAGAAWRPERILCSPALRTRQTLEGVRLALALADDAIAFDQNLYGGDAGLYIEAIRARAGADSLLIVGHNPMIEDVACDLATAGDPRAMDRLRSGVPVSSLAVIAFDDGLGRAGHGLGTLVDFRTPQLP